MKGEIDDFIIDIKRFVKMIYCILHFLCIVNTKATLYANQPCPEKF